MSEPEIKATATRTITSAGIVIEAANQETWDKLCQAVKEEQAEECPEPEVIVIFPPGSDREVITGRLEILHLPQVTPVDIALNSVQETLLSEIEASGDLRDDS